jgi:fucose 4-O-acetylase-like acetyltransferase
MKENDKTREWYLDSACGILLLHMILIHICQWSKTIDYYIFIKHLFAFFMPWFFFKAGMFYKSRPMKEEGVKSFKRLIVPFIVFSAIGTLVLWTKQIVLSTFSVRSFLDLASEMVRVGGVEGNPPMWFLLSLFAVKMIFNFIFRLNKSLIFRGSNTLFINRLDNYTIHSDKRCGVSSDLLFQCVQRTGLLLIGVSVAEL